MFGFTKRPLFLIAWKNLKTYPVRIFLTTSSIILGVAVTIASNIFSESNKSAFDNLFSGIYEGVDLVVQPIQEDFAEGFSGDGGQGPISFEVKKIPDERIEEISNLPSVKAARKSVGWSLFFIFLLYSSAPMLATLSKLSLIDPNLPTGIIGKTFAEVEAIDWYQNWNQANLMFISDFNGNGTLELNEFFMGGKAVVLATPEIAGLPYVISGLVAAGGMAAAMSTADGLILAIANAISHDVYYKIIDPKAETAKRLLVARVLLVIIGFAGATIAAMEIQGILGSVIWAFDFAMSGLFFPLVLGVWWKRANRQGAIAGMLGGLIAGAWYLVWVRTGGSGFLGITQLTFGIFGSAVSLVLMVIVSLMTAEPDKATQKMVDDVRVPSGKSILGKSH